MLIFFNGGFLLILVWCLCTAFAYTFIGSVQEQYMPITMCFYIFLISALFFIIVNLKRLPMLAKRVKCFWREIVNINIITLFCWLFFFYALKYIEPAIVAALLFGSRFVVMLLIERWFYSASTHQRKDYAVSAGIIIAIIYLIFVSLSDYTAIEIQHSFFQIIFGLLASIVSGGMLAAGSISVKRLNLAGFSGMDVMSVRFFLLLILTGTAYYFFIPRAIDDYYFGEIVFVSALSLILIPQLLLQGAAMRLQPVVVAMTLPITPIIVYCLEFADSRLTTSLWTLAGVVAISVLTSYAAKVRYQFSFTLS